MQGDTQAGRHDIGRSRPKLAPAYLAKSLTNTSTPAAAKPRYFRAFDFHKGPEKDAALKSILGL